MFLHARALADAGVDVDLIGFANPHVRSETVSEGLRVSCPKTSGQMHFRLGYRSPILAGARGLSLFWALTRLLLWRVSRPDVILVPIQQGVPALFVAWLAAHCLVLHVSSSIGTISHGRCWPCG